MTLSIRLALTKDILTLRSIAEDAYAPYVAHIGRRPIPMDADFSDHIEKQEIYVASLDEKIIGFIVTYAKETSQFIENIAVSPTAQGSGVGQALIAFADQQAHLNNRLSVTLYTNEKMVESLNFYRALGFVETERKTEQGFNRIYLEKRLSEK